MAVNPDLSKPLSDEEIADLKTRIPLDQVERYIALAAGSEFDGGETVQSDQPPAPSGRRGKAAAEPESTTGDSGDK